MRWFSISWPGFLARRKVREGRPPGRGNGRRSVDSFDRRMLVGPLVAAVGLLVLFQLLFPITPRVDSEFPAEGEIADREIRAPFAFSSPLLERDVEMRRLQKVLVEPPVLRRLPDEAGKSRARFDSWRDAFLMHVSLTDLSIDERVGLLLMRFPEVSPEDLENAFALPDPVGFCEALGDAIDEIHAAGVVDNLPPGNYSKVLILSADGETTGDLDALTPQDELSGVLAAALQKRGLTGEIARRGGLLARSFLGPNLVYSPDATQARREEARASVPTVREFIKGERIVGRGDRVTEQEGVFLISLHDELVARGSIGASGGLFWRRASRLLLAAGLLLIFGWIGWIQFPHILLRLRQLIAVTAVFAVFLAFAAFALDQPELGPFAVPVPLLAVLLTVLFRDRVGYPMTGLAAGMLALVVGVQPVWLICWLIVGLVSVTMVRRIRHRDQFYKAIAVLVFLQVFLITMARLTSSAAVAGTAGGAYFAGVLSPIASVALALFLLPVIEPLVGISSDLTLLELSDLNHPLLKRMALESQGTFHHCQVVAQLAENAARAIGANSLLTRVGALFHDIGKMNKPEYYVENQGGGPNKHDELSPSMSALVVSSHVKEGIEMARRWRLPQAVIDFIPEHHGTSVMKYFYHKALEGEGNETVKVDDFRYPGPRPHSRETAILMLADAVEASTRSLAKPTPGRIREMTKQIVDERMLSGELDECHLTLSDLARIRESFIPLLAGIHHSRIAYPGQRETAAAGGGAGRTES